MRIFLDTNALVSLVNDFASFPSGYHFCTFEKCVYEFGNGVKTKLFNQQFVVSCLTKIASSISQSETEKNTYEDKIAKRLITSTLKILKLHNEGICRLIDAVKRFDLRYEFGTAEELPISARAEFLVNSSGDKEVLLLKLFYGVLKPKLIGALLQIERDLQQLGIDIILYEQVFCDPNNMLDFRMLLKDAFLPAEDLEIVFSAISSNCSVFVTNDGKTKPKGILQDSRTLGLNTIIEFVGIEEFKQGQFYRSQQAT